MSGARPARRPRLLADVGGTNARFAVQRPGEAPTDLRVIADDSFPTLAAAGEAYLEGLADTERPRLAAFAVASPVIGDHIDMTNRAWSFSIEALRRALGLDALYVVNDIEAVALAIPALEPRDRRQLGAGAAVPEAPVGVLAPGTGLGTATLIWHQGAPLALASEGGHATMAAADDDEAAVLGWLRRHLGHVSAERVLSGQGLINLHRALSALAGTSDAPALTAVEIGRHAIDGSDPQARAAVRLFSAMLGTFAGNLALTLGALGGIYIAGGVVPKLGAAFDVERFRARFEDKGRFQPYLARIPTWLVTHETPALLGLAALLDRA
ncbi:MAG TPA: glucokinase [Alphaproteobacteria bacterium]|jgi:glucokinase|nr:glucokinase [Alphaproteobacteria bacterium]